MNNLLQGNLYAAKILFILSFLFIGCSDQNDWNIAMKDGVRLEYPKNWQLIDLESYSIVVKEKAQTSGYSVLSNFSVEVFERYQGKLKEYLEVYKGQMSKNRNFTNWSISSKKNIVFKGYDAYELIAGFNSAGYDIRTKVIIVLKDDLLIKLSATSSEEDFPSNQKVFDRIFESVSI